MKAVRHEKTNFAGQEFLKYSKYSGLTLVELLVVVTIMTILLAISVPMIRPMLETQKTRDAADTVSTFLAQARLRAIETGLPCGVRFERYTGLEMQGQGPNGPYPYYPYNGACLQMRQVAVPRPYGGCVEGTRIDVDGLTGNLTIPFAESGFWGPGKIVQDGDLIQLDYQGPKYLLDLSSGTPKINWQQFDSTAVGRNLIQVPFKVYRQPKPTLAAPVRFPQGVVVDLNSSGKGTNVISYGDNAYDDDYAPTFDNSRIALDDFRTFDQSPQSDTIPVTIMFLPNGEVGNVIHSNNSNNSNEPIFLCIGLWDRVAYWDDNGDIGGLPEDDKWNYQDLSNFWVTLFPKSGTTVIQPVAAASSVPLSSLEERNNLETSSRKFARNQQGIGGR